MDDRDKQIPPPKSWIAFEDLCHSLFKAIWNDPLAQKNGRSGQAQNGVDIYGSPGGDYGFHQGVQCKGKETQYGAKPNISELEREIAKAESFQPCLQHWIYATTAPVDATLQEAARKISTLRSKAGRFTVSVLGWGDIESLLCERKEVLAAIYPEHGIDVTGLLKGILAMPHGVEVRELLDIVKRGVHQTWGAATSNDDGRPFWRPIIFGEGRDLGPALMGRPLGPEDAASSPKLQESDAAVAELKRAFSVRIVGEPGSGKSTCAYQAAMQFATMGWNIVRLSDARADVIELQTSEDTSPTLFLIDDAHLTNPSVLLAAEEMTGPKRFLLSTHNANEYDTSYRGSIIIDVKRAVRTIAAALRSAPKQTLEVVRRVDDQIGDNIGTMPLEDRIDDAEAKAKFPWQFCFILGGGWRRAKIAADTARANGADIALAAAAIRQIASRDASPSFAELSGLLEVVCVDATETQQAVRWLVRERMLIGSDDLRCPHQRFAAVVLAQILTAQNPEGRENVGRMLRQVIADAAFPLAGLRSLLHELQFAVNGGTWAHLIPEQALTPLIERIWQPFNPEDKSDASLLLSELGAYINGGLHKLLLSHEETIGNWITHTRGQSSFGLGRLLHSIYNQDRALVASIVSAADPYVVATTISAVTPKTASYLGELLSGLRVDRENAWSQTFRTNLDRQRLVVFASEWPLSEPAWAFAVFCKAMADHDAALTLDMVEEFVPTAQKLLTDSPVSAFRDLQDITWQVLRVFDPLGVCVGQFAPNPRQRNLAAKLIREVKPQCLAAQLSAAHLREFQTASFLLSFLARTSPAKFRSTVARINWTRIAETVGSQWRNLPHDVEVLFMIAYGATTSREMLTEMIRVNLYRIEAFPPKLFLIAPSVAYEHIEKGGLIRLAQYGHVDWLFGYATIACLVEERPEFLESVLRPYEIPTGQVLSNAHPSWYDNAAEYIRIVAKEAPQCLQRILDAVEITGAEKGWTDALVHGAGPRKTVALLVEASLERDDMLGALATRLRTRFPKLSVPRNTEMRT
ncbi:ATP-binding protein [Collimonas pratensis]|uniref:Novel STAND NTPase 3 domain-containing protein n=1 Tax=Collimonas pratensis TaxID=279113 RepID=A0A127Q8W5_9BURK|nr:ATP-binding protein [Collimonas pratensis]AMP06441.1 hypothetical protein CPter91_4125 [Collimonas pratensis]